MNELTEMGSRGQAGHFCDPSWDDPWWQWGKTKRGSRKARSLPRPLVGASLRWARSPWTNILSVSCRGGKTPSGNRHAWSDFWPISWQAVWLRATFLTPLRLCLQVWECPGLTELWGLEEGTCTEPPTQAWCLISGGRLTPISGWVCTGSGRGEERPCYRINCSLRRKRVVGIGRSCRGFRREYNH